MVDGAVNPVGHIDLLAFPSYRLSAERDGARQIKGHPSDQEDGEKKNAKNKAEPAIDPAGEVRPCKIPYLYFFYLRSHCMAPQELTRVI